MIVPLQTIDSFFDKIKQVPAAQIDQKYVNFVKEFSKIALRKRHDYSLNQYMQENELNGDDNDQENFIKYLIMRESDLVGSLTNKNTE